jgi:hypothetical protein
VRDDIVIATQEDVFAFPVEIGVLDEIFLSAQRSHVLGAGEKLFRYRRPPGPQSLVVMPLLILWATSGCAAAANFCGTIDHEL